MCVCVCVCVCVGVLHRAIHGSGTLGEIWARDLSITSPDSTPVGYGAKRLTVNSK